MTTTTFVNGATLSDANWFNDVDAITYDVFNAATTAALARTAISAARTDGANTFSSGTQTFSGLGQFNLGLSVAGAAFNSRGITDNATAKALTLSGSGANSITIANSATNPTIGTSASDLFLGSDGRAVGLTISGAAASGFVTLSAAGTTPAGLVIAADILALYGQGVEQVRVTGTASANRYITLTGSNDGNPTISVSGGNLAISAQPVLCSATATPAAGSASAAVLLGTTAAFGIYYGSGAPNVSAAQGSLYIRTDGGASTRLYSNNNGSTGWSAITSA